MGLAAADAAAARHAHHHGRRELPTAPIAQARQLAHDLVVSGIDIVRELDLGDRPQAIDRHADRRRDDAAFGNGRVEDAMLTEALLQAVSDAKHPTEIADVLAHDHDRRVALHERAQPRVQGLDHVHARHASAPLPRQLLALPAQMLGHFLEHIIEHRERVRTGAVVESAV
jgi:hypothetical protein